MVKRPSRASNVRVFFGLSIRAQTSVIIVADWIAGQLTGSRRSRRCYTSILVLRSVRMICDEYKHSCIVLWRINFLKMDAVEGCLGLGPKFG